MVQTKDRTSSLPMLDMPGWLDIGRHTALATRALGVAAGCGQDERDRAGALRRDCRALERRTDTRLVTGHRHRVEGRVPLA
jgi:hypothetical protein